MAHILTFLLKKHALLHKKYNCANISCYGDQYSRNCCIYSRAIINGKPKKYIYTINDGRYCRSTLQISSIKLNI